MASCAELVEVRGGAPARQLAKMLGAAWSPAETTASSTKPLIILWGPVGWALHHVARATCTTVLRCSELAPPLQANAVWAMSRFDHLVVGDELNQKLVIDAGLSPPSLIPQAPSGTVTPQTEPLTGDSPVIGTWVDRPDARLLDLLLIVRRLREGALGTCSVCRAERVGRFNPWNSTLESPSCCGPIQPFHPIGARAAIATEAGDKTRPELDRLVNWLGMEPHTELHSVTGQALSEVVGGWSVMLSLAQTPGRPVALIEAAACEVPAIVADFAGGAAISSPGLVASADRLTPTGSVRFSPDPTAATHAAWRLAAKGPYRQRALAAQREVVAAHDPSLVAARWETLIEQMTTDRTT